MSQAVGNFALCVAMVKGVSTIIYMILTTKGLGHPLL